MDAPAKMENLALNKPPSIEPWPVSQSEPLFFDFDTSWHPSLPGVIHTLFREWSGSAGYLSRHADSSCLVLAGHPGSGKTHLARILNDILNLNSVMVNEVHLFELLKRGYSQKQATQEIVRPYQNYNLLIYDDLGIGRGNEQWLEEIYSHLFCTELLDSRSLFQKVKQALLITTNLSREELPSRVGAWITSRLIGKIGDTDKYFIDMFDVKDYRARRK